MAFFRSAYGVAYEPIPVAPRLGRSHIRPLRDGLRFLLIIFKIATLYSPLKLFAPTAVLFALLALGTTTAIAFLGELLPEASGVTLAASKVGAYLALLLVAAAIAATLYRYAPSRENARWEWITPGSLFTAITWVLLTLGFGYYVTSVANYDATYGSLGAVIALLTWMYLSAYVFVIGAELNSEIEHQTAQDSTTGDPQPMGQRGAWSADHVARGTDPEQQVKQANKDSPSLGDAGPPVPIDEPDPSRSS